MKRRAARFAAPLIGLMLVLGGIWLLKERDLHDLEARLLASAAVATTSHGPVAYETGGTGAPVLTIHGAGGGHDQGRLLARAFLPSGHRWIAPSRFGYPGSPMPADASTAAQADAFAELLDGLGVESAAVLAMSGGAPPALQFALRHPRRTQSLILISAAPFAPLTVEDQAPPAPLWLYDALFATDLPLWAAVRLSPRSLAPVFDARSDLVDRATENEAAFVEAMIEAFLPAAQRRAGLRNEGAAVDPRAALDLAAIRAPVLLIHARDDRIAPFSTAAFTAERVPSAELLAFDEGGHLLLGGHAEARRRIAEFLGADAGAAP